MFFFWVLSAALGAGWLSGPLTGAPAPDPAPLVAQLGADDWAGRRAAEAALIEMEPAGLAPLLPFLSRDDLSPEQRLRLRRVALERFRLDRHGGMGVAFDRQPRAVSRGAAVSPSVPGFDAYTRLRPGDTIVAMDGRPIADEQDLRVNIIARRPGDAVTLSVVRGAQLLEVGLTLGDFAALEQTLPLEGALLAAALDVRLALMNAPAPAPDPPVLGGLSLGDWKSGGAVARLPVGASLPFLDEFPGLLVGGEARGQAPGALAEAPGPRRTIRVRPSAPEVPPARRIPGARAAPPPPSPDRASPPRPAPPREK